MTTYYVSPSGSDSNPGTLAAPFLTINHADSAALLSPGDTVIVQPGTYPIATTAMRTNTSGTAGNPITYKTGTTKPWANASAQNAVLSSTVPYTAAEPWVWDNRGNYVVIQGFEITGTATPVGIDINGGQYCRVLNNYIHDLGTAVPNTQPGAAIFDAGLNGSQYNEVAYNVVNKIGTQTTFNQLTHGLYPSGSYGFIHHNIVANCAGWGIHCLGDTYLGSACNHHNIVANNLCFENTYGGLVFATGDSSTADYMYAVNNVMMDNGKYTLAAYGIREEANTGTNSVYDHNLTYSNSGGGNYSLLNGLVATNQIVSAPTFVNFRTDGTGDYHPASGSPTIDAGTGTLPSWNTYWSWGTDLDGNTLPLGGGYDVGPYEFVPVTPPPSAPPPTGTRYQSVILADHPHAYYPLNDASGSTFAADASGNGYTGTYGTSGITLGAAPALPGDTTDTGVTSANTGGIATLPTAAAPATGAAPWSLEAWVVPQSAALDSGYHALVTFGTDAAGEMAGLYLHGGSVIFTGYSDDSTPGAALVAGSLHHAAVTYDGATATVYLDGASVATKATVLAVAVAGVQIGRNVTGKYDHVAATLYHVALYGYALSAAQVAAHYTAGITPPAAPSPVLAVSAAIGPLPLLPPAVLPGVYSTPGPAATGAIYAIVAGNTLTIQHGSLHITRTVGQRSTGQMTVIDLTNTLRFKQGDPFTIYDQQGRRVWAGVVMADSRARSVKAGDVAHRLTLADWHYLADKRTAAYTNTNVTAGTVVRDMLNQYLGQEGVTAGTIATGPTITGAVVAAYVPVSSVLDAIVQKCGTGWYWTIDDDKRLQFLQQTSAPLAPFVADEDVMEMESLTPAHGNPNYANSVYVLGGTAQTAQQTETRQGDGKATAFTMSYDLANVVPTITLNSVAQTVALKTVGTGAQWYWAPGDPVIAQDSSGTKLVSTDTLSVTYTGQFPNVAISTDGGAVAAQQAREGVGSGTVETAVIDTTLTSTSQAFQSAAGYLSKYAQDLDTLTFATTDYGLQEGQLLTVNDPADDFDNQQMLIESIDITDTLIGGDIDVVWYTVKAVSGPVNAGWQAFFKGLASQGQAVIDSIQVGQSQTVAILASFTATWAWAASLTVTAYTCPVFPLTLSPATLC